jgi:hypothetical protein
MRSMTTHDSSRKGRRYTSSSMHLVDLLPLLDDAETTGQVIDRSRWIWSDIYDAMDPEDTLWVFAPNARKNSRYWPIAMAIADAAREDSGLALKNTITRYQDPKPGGDLSNAYEEVLFFVKDKRQYRFSKDEIRVAHVYEGKDWTENRDSGRSAYHDTQVRRYNPNGRDPGNVWFEEIRDRTPDETVDETRPLSRVNALTRCLRAASEPGETVHTYWIDEEFERVITEHERGLHRVERRETTT